METKPCAQILVSLLPERLAVTLRDLPSIYASSREKGQRTTLQRIDAPRMALGTQLVPGLLLNQIGIVARILTTVLARGQRINLQECVFHGPTLPVQ